MARESKRKRDERRFGKPERLADKVCDGSWGIPVFYRGHPKEAEQYRKKINGLIEDVANAHVVVCSNVTEYYFAANKAKEFDWQKDIHCWSLPFPLMFIETTRPERSFDSEIFPQDFPKSWGWILYSTNMDGTFAEGVPVPGRIALHQTFPSTTTSLIWAELVEEVDGILIGADASVMIPIDDLGRCTEVPVFTSMLGMWEAQESSDERKSLIERGEMLASPVFLALAFMNARGTTLNEVAPSQAVNRERKKGGRCPFVRYRTIDVDPARSLLKTVGNIDSVGLSRAMHLCRGSFATYGTSFMGRPLDKPMTVWRPAHVRGSAKHGVVVSDYNVKAPTPNA